MANLSLLGITLSSSIMQQLRMMKASCHLGILVVLHLFTEAHLSTSCGTFGNGLDHSNPPTMASSNYIGIFAGIGSPLQCTGNATRWNVCYYPTASSTSASATLQVYRCASGNSSCGNATYAPVSGSTITVTSPIYTSTPPNYVCTNISLTSPFAVNTGDVLVGCIPQNNGLHIAAIINGSSVHYSNDIGCSSQISLSNNGNLQSGLTLLINLDVNECAVNNGGCSQMCNDTTAGYSCSCYPGYILLPDGLNCSSTSASATTPTTTILTSSVINVAGAISPVPIILTSTFIISSTPYTIFNTATPAPSSSTSTVSVIFSNIAKPQEGSGPVILASFIIIVIIAIVVTTVTAISIVLWRKRYANQLKTSNTDIVVYSTASTSATILSNKAGTSAVYDPLEDDVSKFAQEAQAIYETPHIMQAPRAQSDNDKQMPVYSNDAMGEDENPYEIPAPHEEELYVQLENQRIKKIPQNSISVTTMLGSGHFGGVQIGIWNGSKGKCEVAIKTLNPTITQPDAKVKFLQEAAIMAQFRHPNVIQLYGIVTDEEPVMLVIELAHNKDLRTHLATLKPDPGQLAHHDLYLSLLTYSKQIAAGMKYLSNKSFVHRDLAARNILVTQDCICKIGDFGMSRALDDDTYVSHGGMVPIRWTAPEAIHFKTYSTASDVWSYGCLLYEIWSLGSRPYDGVEKFEIVQKVDSGYRLPPPPGCPLLVYQLMIQCWNPVPHSRPTFQEINLILCHSSDQVLHVPDEAHLTHPQAGVLGAPLEAGENMYIELQKTYV